uniref:Uncharacterized protein n=1 Tax=Megaselia scalaris TaxID=36166 RepID=T1H1W8_MEGSC
MAYKQEYNTPCRTELFKAINQEDQIKQFSMTKHKLCNLRLAILYKVRFLNDSDFDTDLLYKSYLIAMDGQIEVFT